MTFATFRSAVALAAAFTTMACAQAQFNIKFGGYSELVPSAAYGAAANQPGVWNNIGRQGPTRLIDIRGRQTNATITWDDQTFGERSMPEMAPTDDDFSRLMTGPQVGTTAQGGFLTITFDHLPSGVYDVYTYASRRLDQSNTGIFIAESLDVDDLLSLQTVIGPAGTTLIRLRTHSLHRVSVDGRGKLTIKVVRPADNNIGAGFINGVQVVPVVIPRKGG